MTILSKRRMLGQALLAAMLATGIVQASDTPPPVRHITDRYAISPQIRPEHLAALSARGYTTVVALRPDGEGSDQPAAADLEAAAKTHGIKFVYVPVTSAGISEPQVGALASALAGDTGKVLAYCRSGSRAARVWSLVEASRPQGLDTAGILAAVKDAGQSAENLEAEIAGRIARRPAKN